MCLLKCQVFPDKDKKVIKRYIEGHYGATTKYFHCPDIGMCIVRGVAYW